jgi:hypothetical protein
MRSLVQGRFDTGGKNRGIGKKLLMSFGNRVGRRVVSQGWRIWCERTKKQSGKRMSYGGWARWFDLVKMDPL